MKPLIGITTGAIVNIDEAWGSKVYGQKHTYSDAVIAAGGVPVLIPFMPEEQLRELYEKLDGIIFAGGNDLDPALYGELPEPETVDVTPARDRVECLLMNWALKDDKPLLSICRGFQLLNVLLGGTLYQDVQKSLAHASNHEISRQQEDYTYIAHTLRLAPESKFARITNSLSMKANTHHHQGIKRVANELRAVAWAEDGLVESLEHPSKTFVLGVQCHPEALFTIDEKWLAVFKSFIGATTTKTVTREVRQPHGTYSR